MLWKDEHMDIGMDFQRLKISFMGKDVFNNLSGLLKTTYILEVTLMYGRFFLDKYCVITLNTKIQEFVVAPLGC